MSAKTKVAITILISIILFIIIDFLSYTIDWFAIEKEHKKFDTYLPPFKYSWKLDPDPYSYIISKSTFRKPLNTNSKKGAIYIFGCSFAYGEKLQPSETFGANLTKLTKRPVYNFAYPGFSVQHMIYQLETMTFPKNTSPDYIIYVYIDDHIRRMQTEFMQAYELTRFPLYVQNKNGELEFKKTRNFSPSIFYVVKKLKCFQAKYRANHFEKENFELLEKHFLKANDLIKQKFPQSKFIILLYTPNDSAQNHDWTNLQKQNIKVITTNELTDLDLQSEDYKRIDGHPKANVWQLLTPKFIQKSDIN